MRCFYQEKETYAHLLHYGVCDKGIVPHCFGWLDLSHEDINALRSFKIYSDDRDDLCATSNIYEELPPKGLLLEYLPSFDVLSIHTITTPIAEKVIRSMCDVHAAYVKHGNIHRRNILLLPEGRIVWSNFDNSVTIALDRSEGEHMPKLTRQRLMEELSAVWSLLYVGLVSDIYVESCAIMTQFTFAFCHSQLPDKRIGFERSDTLPPEPYSPYTQFHQSLLSPPSVALQRLGNCAAATLLSVVILMSILTLWMTQYLRIM